MNILMYGILLISWIIGVVLANGFWSTLFSIVFFPYGWYITIEKILTIIGWI